MIYHLKHNEIDLCKWDNVAQKQFVPYACSWFLNCVSPNWEALIFNDYKAIMPLTSKKKWGIPYLAQPFFTQQSGIFGSNVNEHLIHDFLSQIDKKYRYIDINLNECNFFENTNGRIFIPQKNILLNLNKPFETLYKNFSDNTKRMIKKAEKQCLNINQHEDANELIELFKKTKGQYLKHLTNNAYNNLNCLIKVLSQHTSVSIQKVYKENQLLGGAVFVKFNQRIIFFFSALNDLGKQYGAMHYLISDVIKKNADSNLILDFEGSNNANLARFYKSFGSNEVVYLRYKNNKLPYPFKWLKK